MLEVCFNHGVSGSLKCAQHPSGRGVHVATVFGRDENGRQPTDEEIEAHLRKVREEQEKALAEMIPLGGTGGDVFEFPMALHMGDISEEFPLSVMKNSYYSEKPHPLKKGLSYCEFVVDELERLIDRAKKGEDIRAWYCSRNPEDVCGLCWFLWTLKERKLCPTVWLMNLPEFVPQFDGTMVVSRGWGEIEPEKFGSYLHLRQKTCDGFFAWAAMTWKQLQQENAPLRAIINGKITSVEESFYDSSICAELRKQPEIFKVPHFIGAALQQGGLYAVGDEFIHQRLMAMVKMGELQIVTPGEDGGYRGQILKKIKI